MKSFPSMAGREQASSSNRRQPVRQARTNPLRASTTTQFNSTTNAQPPEDTEAAAPGFFPAITHFTDAITALPKEMIRHYTMLKEVDAKIYGREEMLGQIFHSALKMPPPARWGLTQSQGSHGDETRPHVDEFEVPRKELFQNMRLVMGATLAILDEKNHVMNTAIDALEKQLRRCQSSFPYIEEEISEEARYGSMTHWAYTDKASEKKGIIAGERTRRAAVQEVEGSAVRSELRREAVTARKGRNQHVDSDFDDARGAGRKGLLASKGRKAAEPSYSTNGVGLGISNAAGPPSKRRRTEKAVVGSVPMERAMSSVYGSNTGSARGNIKETPTTNPKKPKATPAAANGSNRRRGNTNNSVAHSPAASSPIIGSFTATNKDRQGKSPAPPAMQRVPSARARQGSTQNVSQVSRNRSASTNHNKSSNGPSGNLYGTSADVEKLSGLTGRSVADVKSTMKETVSSKGEHLVEDVTTNDGAGDLRGGIVVGTKASNERSAKKEEPEPSLNGSKSRAERPPSISTRGGGSKQPSANPTPQATSFGDQQQKPRAPARASDPPVKRSHKKGAGLAAQLAAAVAARGSDAATIPGEDGEEDGENEPRYCYCNGVSYGEMVGCDADNCSREWFHLQCVGLTKAPAKNAKWYCDECKENLKKQKFNGGTSR